MYGILVTEQFCDDLDGLDKVIRERLPETIKRIKEDPQYLGLRTHRHITVTD